MHSGRPTFVEAARRAHIVAAAIDTIAEVGCGKASFAAIAERAGISPSLISYHFTSRRELLAQIVRDVNADLERALDGRAEAADNHLGVLRALIEGYVHYCAQHPEQLIAVGRIEEHDGSGDESREQSIGEFAEVLAIGLDNGEFREFAPRPMAVTLLAALEAVPTELMTHPDTDVEAYARELATTFELAVRKDPR